jgi:hypothetical protein
MLVKVILFLIFLVLLVVNIVQGFLGKRKASYLQAAIFFILIVGLYMLELGFFPTNINIPIIIFTIVLFSLLIESGEFKMQKKDDINKPFSLACLILSISAVFVTVLYLF